MVLRLFIKRLKFFFGFGFVSCDVLYLDLYFFVIIFLDFYYLINLLLLFVLYYCEF